MREILHRIIDELRGAWRFRRYALLAAWAVCLVGWAVVFVLPDMYEAKARMFVDTRTALGPVLTGLTIQQDVNAQLNFVRQSLLSRPQLERVARETDLDLRAKTPEARAVLIDALAKRIQLTANDAGGSGLVFTLQFQDRERDMSLRVVDRLMNTFVEGTLGGKRIGSEVAQKFLRDQIEEYEQRLRAAEERLADFKRRNVGLMPGAQGDYFSRLQNEMTAVEKAQAELSVALKGREELARQLRGEASIAVTQAPSGAKDGDGNGADTPSRIRDTQKRLDELLLQYTEKHPDVIALRETLAQLEARRDAELAALRNGDGTLPASASANPVVQSIQLQLNKADVEIAALRARIADGQRKVAELRKLVDTAPEVEAEFARLNRDYDVTRERYVALVDRAERTKLGDQAEQTDTVRFEVIDPPAAKLEPVAPNRPLLLAAVLLVGLGAGGGLAFVLHQLRPVFSSSRALHEVTGLPVLGVVSRTWLDKYRLQQRRQYIGYSVGAVALVMVFVVVLRFSDVGVRAAQRLLG